MKAKTIVILVVVIAVLAAIKIIFLSPKQQQGGQQQGNKQVPAVPVTVVIVKSATVENKITVSGNILANEEAMLKSETAGKMISLEVNEGAEVQKGQLIAKINDATLQAQLKKAKVQQKLAQEKEQRLKQLLAVKGISQDEYDVALTALNSANADIDLLNAQIMETEVRAPFNGIIGLKNISEGNYINTSDIIASIQQIDPVKTDFSVPEKYTSMVHVNDTVLITVEGTKKQYKGKVYAIDPKIDANTRSLKVRAICHNNKRDIFPGSYAQVDLILRSENSVIVPTMAVIPDLRGQKTYVVRNGKAEMITIETGSRTDATIEVTKGLKNGDTLVTGGILSLKNGSPVKIQGLKKEK
ncbi:MAG TPA: efflux RND transporter periplasmic adaptor subunit [Bacteroidia bacterium]|jgi:membrane fusion protein (multidrug efflux system)|nr:efflux RND transporter periplasmic adaptor subunit [Bacteroidia bacterium]